MHIQGEISGDILTFYKINFISSRTWQRASTFVITKYNNDSEKLDIQIVYISVFSDPI